MTIYDLFDGLDLCAPGDPDCVGRICEGVAPGARVLDAGCGRGADLPTLMAAVPGARIVALEAAQPFVDLVTAAHPGVLAVLGDMAEPPGGPFDLIWSGGAIYNLGVTPALRAWRPHLAPGGRVAFSDLVLRGDTPPRAVAEFFAADGVMLRDEIAMRDEVAAAGFRVIETFWMPDSAFASYYVPLEPRIEVAARSDDTDTRLMAEAFREEIALWRKHGAVYGYLVCVAVPE